MWGYWLIESKRFGSVALLRFERGTREAYHSHAFESVSWLLSGKLVERHLNDVVDVHVPSVRPIRTHRTTFHKVHSVGRSWVLTFRGPWTDRWFEVDESGRTYRLTHGRKEVA